MSASEIPLRRTIDTLRLENVKLRKALAETNLQLAETVEELKICALPFFRAWRLRRLLRRRARAVRTLKEGLPHAPRPEPIESPEPGPDLRGPPLIVIPGR
jgi:hypothetical protein